MEMMADGPHRIKWHVAHRRFSLQVLPKKQNEVFCLVDSDM
jgi:hypothetical protein